MKNEKELFLTPHKYMLYLWDGIRTARRINIEQTCVEVKVQRKICIVNYFLNARNFNGGAR